MREMLMILRRLLSRFSIMLDKASEDCADCCSIMHDEMGEMEMRLTMFEMRC